MTKACCTAVLVLGVLVWAPNAQAQTKKISYAFTELPWSVSSDTTAAYRINNNGQVVGRAYAPVGGSLKHVCIWEQVSGQWTVRDLGSPAYYTDAYPRNINEWGQIVGFDMGSDPVMAFFYDDTTGSFETLPTLEGLDPRGVAYAINDDGIICGGSAANGADRLKATLWQSEDGVTWTVTDLAALFDSIRDCSSLLFDINDEQQIVGNSTISSGDYYRAHLWERNVDGWTMTDLCGDLPTAQAINELGLIAGEHAVNGTRHACIWERDPSGAWSLDDLSELASSFSQTFALDINDLGQVVGKGSLASGSIEPYLYQNKNGVKQLQNLNDFLPAGSGWSLVAASGINNQGQIVGNGYNPTGRIRGFLMDTRAVTYSYTSTGSAVSIKDNASASKAMTLTDAKTIADLNVTVNLYHANYADLKFELIGPDNVTRVLCNPGAVTGSGTKTLVFDDDGTAGSIVPVNALSYYDGKGTLGKWTLKISDKIKNRKTGSFTSFTLSFAL